MEYAILRAKLYAKGVKRIEFHSFGKRKKLEDEVAIMRAIVNGLYHEAPLFGDSHSVKHKEVDKTNIGKNL
jgi:hypothetical protein